MPEARTDTCRYDSQKISENKTANADQLAFTDIVCDPSKTSSANVLSVITIPAGAKPLDNVTTIALDGVLFFSGTISKSVGDPFYPTSAHVEKVDGCMGQADVDGTYFYRTASPCLQSAYSPL